MGKGGVKREVVKKEDLQSIESATSRGKRKVEKAVTSETSQKSGPKKKAKKVIEDVIDEEEALVLICDGCENEFFYDDLYPKGDYEVPEGDWFCPSCDKPKSSGKAKGKAAAPASKAKTKAKEVNVEEVPRRSTRARK